MRKELIDQLKREIIGPDPVEGSLQEDGQEILSQSPDNRYVSGALYPKDFMVRDVEVDLGDTNEIEDFEIDSDEEVVSDKIINDSSGDDERDGSTDQTLNLANEMLPSAVGFSCYYNSKNDAITVKLKAGLYNKRSKEIETKTGEIKNTPRYYRQEIEIDKVINSDQLPSSRLNRERVNVYSKEGMILTLSIVNRKVDGENYLLTFVLINESKFDNKSDGIEKTFFQIKMTIQSSDNSKGFLPLPRVKRSSLDEDERSNELLFRKRKKFGIGHGCAVIWNNNDGLDSINSLETSFMPKYELMPIAPSKFQNINLSMYEFSDHGDKNKMFDTLKKLASEYKIWIDNQILEIESLEDEYIEAANENIEKCKFCLDRIDKGIRLLEHPENQDLLDAFCLMNRSMLMQQLHYANPLTNWKKDPANSRKLIFDPITLPDIHDSESWPKGLGNWRPFQIAFIIMNISSFVDDESGRKLLDLIWFPTGGGKTEAYLGLTAFTIFLKKLRDKNSTGTMILMRYTLRLLTKDQFERASTLICACEKIRRDNQETLGNEPITIGLWAGSDLTPNSINVAKSAFNQLESGRTKHNPFILLKCPWCGLEMGKIQNQIKGYKKIRGGSIVFRCTNPSCDFNDDDYPLPVRIVDEDLYNSPPSLVIGTVDKFASIHWKPETESLFGLKNGQRIQDPPELIIQDELHLISGPLGSMVGHYETLISRLCYNEKTGKHAKIIASTATISRAREQCHNLYNCGQENVIQFPPSGLETGDTFFSFLDKEQSGRIYIGISSNTGKSYATSQIITHSALLQGIKLINCDEESKRNPYWTIVMYYNSIRELGAAATHLRADIPDYLNQMYLRKNLTDQKKIRRFVNNIIELTSRVPGYQIPEYINSLKNNYPKLNDNYPVDACLSTNMISVGIDVSRLGLMTIIGQPKTTSEYIQASSRVGRSQEGPGVVVTIYNQFRPRDKSIYEDFYGFHSNLYAMVEPSSVTPFSAPVRERSLHAVMVGLLRLFFNEFRDNPRIAPDNDTIEKIKEIISKRVESISPNELEDTLRLLDDRLSQWGRFQPPIYGGMGTETTEEHRLMYNAGSEPHKAWKNKSWPTQTSMRNVDLNCEVDLIGQYPERD